MTSLNPTQLDGGVSLAFKFHENGPVKVFSNGDRLYVPFEIYERLCIQNMKETQSSADYFSEVTDRINDQTEQFRDMLSNVNKKWSDKLQLSEREKLICTIAIAVLAIVVVALAAALTISLIVLL